MEKCKCDDSHKLNFGAEMRSNSGKRHTMCKICYGRRTVIPFPLLPGEDRGFNSTVIDKSNYKEPDWYILKKQYG